MTGGQFVYVPVQKEYVFDEATPGTKILTFHKVYEPLQEVPIPLTLFGDAATVPAPTYLNDPALRLQVLLPDNLSFDMAVNIFTYDPGATLPFVETHVMEHGMIFLSGGGVYRLDADWHPVTTGDAIWIAPYCPQWFIASGPGPARYIYYKDVNRLPR